MMQGAKGNAGQQGAKDAPGQGPAHKTLNDAGRKGAPHKTLTVGRGSRPQEPPSGRSVVGAAPSAPAKRTMPRLKGFDYSRPFFYMVTLKRLPGLAPFSQIAEGEKPERFLIENETTRAFTRVVRAFHTTCRGIAPIDCFTIMPDHLHLLMKLEEGPDTKPLGTYVHWLMRALARAYWAVQGQGNAPGQGAKAAPGQGPAHTTLNSAGRQGAPHKTLTVGGGIPPDPLKSAVGAAPSAPAIAPIFHRDWHDWIVKRDGQLAAFTRYIRENPERAWLRKRNAQYFGSVRKVAFLGREWFAYGNTALLDLPALFAVKGHRTTKPGSPEWNAIVDGCARIGPGGAGVGTFMSPLEKECGDAIASAGGKLIVLSPEGFHERWHPPREKERFCAEGRMLFLSLYPALDHQPTNAELYARCHEMGDIVVAALPQP